MRGFYGAKGDKSFFFPSLPTAILTGSVPRASGWRAFLGFSIYRTWLMSLLASAFMSLAFWVCWNLSSGRSPGVYTTLILFLLGFAFLWPLVLIVGVLISGFLGTPAYTPLRYELPLMLAVAFGYMGVIDIGPLFTPTRLTWLHLLLFAFSLVLAMMLVYALLRVRAPDLDRSHCLKVAWQRFVTVTLVTLTLGLSVLTVFGKTVERKNDPSPDERLTPLTFEWVEILTPPSLTAARGTPELWQFERVAIKLHWLAKCEDNGTGTGEGSKCTVPEMLFSLPLLLALAPGAMLFGILAHEWALRLPLLGKSMSSSEAKE